MWHGEENIRNFTRPVTMYIEAGNTGHHCPKIIMPLQSLSPRIAECLLRAQPDSVANHITACLISINV